MKYFGATYDFVCDKPIEEIQAAWNAAGPYRWKAFDNDQYRIYIVAYESETNLKIKVLGETPNYSLEWSGRVAAAEHERSSTVVFSAILERLLPMVGATSIRDTSYETRRID
jgi:hypothetical protein